MATYLIRRIYANRVAPRQRRSTLRTKTYKPRNAYGYVMGHVTTDLSFIDSSISILGAWNTETALPFISTNISATMHADVPNSITLGFINTSLEALTGANLTGGFIDTTLSATGTLLETISADLPFFESTLSASVNVDERITASFGFISSTLTALGGANAALTAPVFGFSASMTSNNNRINAALGFINTSLSASGTLEQKMSFSGGFIDTYLSYCSVDIAAPLFSLSASMSAGISNSVAYCLNVNTQESWKWSNMPFQHIIHIGNKPYGVKSDGLYLLEGATDSGTAINAIITTKSTDFGSFKSKNLPYVYLNSDSSTTITPIVDDIVKLSCPSSFGGRKTKLSLKNQGRYWQLKIDNIIKLQGLEALPEVHQRRVK